MKAGLLISGYIKMQEKNLWGFYCRPPEAAAGGRGHPGLKRLSWYGSRTGVRKQRSGGERTTSL